MCDLTHITDDSISAMRSRVNEIPGWPMQQQKFNGPKIELQLYRHSIMDCGALLLSRDGCRNHARMIPRSLLLEPVTTQIVKVDGEACDFGLFSIAEFKAKELGWMVVEDARQLRLV